MMKKAFFVISAVLEGGVIGFFVLAAIGGNVAKGDMVFFAACLLTVVLFMAISLSCISRCRAGKEKLVGHSLLMKLSVFFTCFPFAFLSFSDGIYAFSIFFFIGLVITGITLAVIKRKPRVRTYDSPVKAEKYSFSYKGKWEWDAAAAEYMRLRGISGAGDLTEDQKDLIYGYTAVPFSYMFYWLAVSGHLNERFTAEFGRNGLIEDMKARKVTAAEVLGELDYCFGSEYMKKDVIPFFRAYYDSQGRFGIRDNYIFDYYEAIGEPEDRYYCEDFSWDVCDFLETRIEERYSKWEREFGSGPEVSYYDNEATGRTVHTELFGADLRVHLCGRKETGFPADYDERCLEALDGLPELQLEKLERFLEREYGAGSDPDIFLIGAFRPDTLFIIEPREEGDVVFAVSGEAGFEPEHGISFTVRNGIVLNWGFASDIEDPYSSENIRNYENEPSFDISSLRSDEDADAFLKSGELVKVRLLPGLPYCSMKGGEEYVYLTPCALKEKEKYERYIRNIRAFSGIHDLEMIYVPEYYMGSDGKRLSAVPKDIFIRTADSASPVKAFFRVNVWN